MISAPVNLSSINETFSQPDTMKTNSSEGYLITAAVELCPANCGHDIELLRSWMLENMAAVVERASALQSDFLNRFFKSDAMQDEAKRIVCDKVWEGARK